MKFISLAIMLKIRFYLSHLFRFISRLKLFPVIINIVANILVKVLRIKFLCIFQKIQMNYLLKVTDSCMVFFNVCSYNFNGRKKV